MRHQALEALDAHPDVRAVRAAPGKKYCNTPNAGEDRSAASCAVTQVVLTGQGRNFCAGIDFSALEVVTHVLDPGCPGRERERLLRSIQRWQVLLAEPQQAEVTRFQR